MGYGTTSRWLCLPRQISFLLLKNPSCAIPFLSILHATVPSKREFFAKWECRTIPAFSRHLECCPQGYNVIPVDWDRHNIPNLWLGHWTVCAATSWVHILSFPNVFPISSPSVTIIIYQVACQKTWWCHVASSGVRYLTLWINYFFVRHEDKHLHLWMMKPIAMYVSQTHCLLKNTWVVVSLYISCSSWYVSKITTFIQEKLEL